MADINNDVTNVEGLDTITDANYTANTGDYLLFFSTGNSNRTLTLPLPIPTNQGLRLFIKKIDSGTGTVIIDANTSGSTIDGSNSMVITDQYGGVEIVNNGSVWLCMSDGRASKTVGFTGNLNCATASVGTFINGHLVSST